MPTTSNVKSEVKKAKRVYKKKPSVESEEALRLKLGINPNYKGRISKYVKQKQSLNYKPQDFADNPLRYLENQRKKLDKQPITSKKIIIGESDNIKGKFAHMYKYINTDKFKKLAKIITMLLLSLTAIFIKNRGVFQHAKKIYDMSSASLDNDLIKNGIKISPTLHDKIISFINEYIKSLSDSRFTFESIAGVFVFLHLVIDEIPALFLTDFDAVKDIGILKLAKNLAGNVAEVAKAAKKPDYNRQDLDVSKPIKFVGENAAKATPYNARRIMEKMGYKGSGIGKNETGNTSPIKVEYRDNTKRYGVGYKKQSKSEKAKSLSPKTPLSYSLFQNFKKYSF
jgi:hypothetical protein